MGASGPRQREHPRRQPPRSVRSRGSRRGCQARERHRPRLKGKYFLVKEFTHPAPSYRTAITQPTSNPQSAENLNSKSQHLRQCGNSSSHLNVCLLTSDKESINKRRGSTPRVGAGPQAAVKGPAAGRGPAASSVASGGGCPAREEKVNRHSAPRPGRHPTGTGTPGHQKAPEGPRPAMLLIAAPHGGGGLPKRPPTRQPPLRAHVAGPPCARRLLVPNEDSSCT